MGCNEHGDAVSLEEKGVDLLKRNYSKMEILPGD
jgi:hypothetical protein